MPSPLVRERTGLKFGWFVGATGPELRRASATAAVSSSSDRCPTTCMRTYDVRQRSAT